MEFRSVVAVLSVALLAVVLLACFVEQSEAQTGVCYRQTSNRQGYNAYRRGVYYYSYSCGWWGWRRCRRARYYNQRYTAYRATYGRQFACCGGYRQSGSSCIPVCNPGCANGGTCTAPNRCNCPNTWTGSYCQTDKDECAANTDGCAQICINTNGGYRCACNTGYILSSNGRSCPDVDECIAGTHRCAHNCHNTPGSYTCSCRTGYSLFSDGVSCNDIDECTNGQHRCAQNCHNTPGSYTCSCNTGYSLNTDDRGCSDIDECATNRDQCSQICTNTVGSYTCSCNSTGYRLASNGRTCDDINECTEGTHLCDHNCANTVGSYTCSCRTGYRLASNGRTCNDINECSEGTHQCAQNCINNPGSYTCSCNAGYTLNADGRRCDDIDECALDTDRCAQNCHNTIGSYTCSCNVGYRLNSNGYGCDDIDECAEGTDRCAQNCHNTIGSYTCSCNTGYRLNPDEFACDDINECSEGTHRCAQMCHNNIGSYTCSCNTGYRLNTDGFACDDIDECALGTDRCAQNCHNTNGSYTCSCNIGYRLNSNGYGCDDIDECSEGTHNCSQICNNTIGSYTCACRIGYRLNADGRQCDDIDECAEDTDRCEQNCHNTVGTYTCSCNIGYRLNADGFACDDIDECFEGTHNCSQICNNTIGSYTCGCRVGYVLNADGRRCDDIDECTLGIDRCDQNCHNSIGSYTCSCNTGWRLDADGFRCNDINECLPGGIGNTTCHQVCVNDPGSYHCECFIGYRLRPDMVNCMDIDECAENTDECDHICRNTIGSYTCSCFNGYQLDIDGVTCDDLDECADGTSRCDQECTNTIGSYVCGCRPGYFLHSDNSTCEDINECLTIANLCEQQCINAAGSFVCRCNVGFSKTNDGLGCIGPPQDVIVTPSSSRAIGMAWQAPTAGAREGYLIDYSIVCNSPQDGEFFVSESVSNDTTSYSISVGVKPYTTYRCCVVAQRTNGDSPLACGTIITLEDVPETPPDGITFVTSSPYNLTVDWLVPIIPNGVIIGYTLYADFLNGSNITKRFDSQTMTYTIFGLEPYQSVDVQLSASTTLGEGPVSDVNIVRTLQTAPSQIGEITVHATSDTSMAISWEEPEDLNGVLLYYDVTVTLTNGTVVYYARKSVNESRMVTVDTGLGPITAYIVKVVAATEAGESTPITQVAFTKEGIPVKPVITAVARRSGSDAIVAWQPITPDDANGHLTMITIAYQKVERGSVTCPSIDPTSPLTGTIELTEQLDRTQIDLTSLLADSEYCVAIQTSTIIGDSGFSEEQRLILSDSNSIQIRVQLPQELPCQTYSTSDIDRKIEDIKQAIATNVLSTCNCNIFSSQYITDAMLLCGNTEREVIFNARLLSTSDKTPEELRNTVQTWVNKAQNVTIANVSLKIDSYCKVEISKVNSPNECASDHPTEATINNGTSVVTIAIYVAGGVGGATVLFLVLACVLLICCCCCSRKETREQYKESRRDDMNVQSTQHRPRNSAVSSFGSSADDTAFLVGSKNVGTLQRRSQVVDEYEPSYGFNESTLKRMKTKEKEAQGDDDYDFSGYNPTYIDDDDDY